MESRWDGEQAAEYGDDLLALRAYSSRLLGADPDLVLHGGGNTSVKIDGVDLHGETQRLLYVKGSGWDLASIEPAGFAPLRIEPVRRLTELESLSDSDMMRSLRSASVDPDAPAPSVETITHAVVPHRFTDHTHADAVVTISNTADGAGRLRDLYGDEVLVVPYAMPGFVLAKLIADLTADVDWTSVRGMILMNHGVFTFADDAQASYEAMIEVVSRAEAVVAGSLHAVAKSSLGEVDMVKLATLRRAVSDAAGMAMIARLNDSAEAVGFAGRRDAGELAGRGCLTPDHVLHTKPSPVVVGDDPAADVAEFGRQYEAYFSRNAEPSHAQLDPAPRWAIWPGTGIVGFGPTADRAGVVADITTHAIGAMQVAEELSGWQPPGEKELFDVEYWELEQAKLKRGGPAPPLQGKIAVVTGAASGIGRACADVLLARGAAVAALDVNPAVTELFDSDAATGFICDVTDSAAVDAAIDGAVRRFGGLDIVIANAGTFPPGMSIDELDDETWSAVIDVNLTGHMRVLRAAAPYLRLGIDAAVVVIASKNVPAPGPGAAAYSAAKAGLTQLARVAALEFGPDGVRVNVIHPNAVFDTGIWTDEVLQNRADHYGITVDEYRRNNVLGVDISSRDVAEMAAAMAGPLFGRTTGAQVPVDGGNERVI